MNEKKVCVIIIFRNNKPDNLEEEKNNNKECAMIRKYWLYIFDELLSGNEILGWETKQLTLSNKQIEAKRIWRKTWKSN